jgi:hypothetical protein
MLVDGAASHRDPNLRRDAIGRSCLRPIAQQSTMSADIPPVPVSTSTPSLGGLGRVLNAGGDAVQRALEQGPVADRVEREYVAHVAPKINAAGARADRFVSKTGERADRAAEKLRAASTHLQHVGAGKIIAAPVDAAGKIVHSVAGKDTLRNTSLLVFGGLRVGAFHFNAGATGMQYIPSMALAEKAGSFSGAMQFRYGADVQSPVGGVGWSTRGKASATVNLLVISASYDTTGECVFVGIPGVMGVTLGTDVERGSFVTLRASIPLTPLLFFGPMAMVGGTFYTPLLDGVNRVFTRPVAKALSKAVRRAAKALRQPLRQLNAKIRSAARERAPAVPTSADGPRDRLQASAPAA